MLTNPGAASKGTPDASAREPETVARREELDQGSESGGAHMTIAARPAAILKPDTSPAVTSQTVVPSLPIPQQLVSPKVEEPQTAKHVKVLLAGILMLAVVAAAFAAYQIGYRRAKQPAIRSLAVLPLKNLSGDQAQQYLADGITEELIGRLAGIRDLRVISRTSVMRFADTQLSLPQIAKMLSVDAVVEGSVMRDGDRIRVHAQLIRAATDEHFWSESYDRELRDVLAMDADVAQAVAHKVEVTITGEEHRRLAAVRSVSPEVYETISRASLHSPKATTNPISRRVLPISKRRTAKIPHTRPATWGWQRLT